MGTFKEIRIRQQENKDMGIESLRGFAIFLVVAFHIIGNNPNTGIHVSDNSFWRYLTYTLEFIRLPIFVAISGYVYALKPVQVSTGTEFLTGKARRILLPFVIVSSLQYIANTYAPNTNNHYEMQNIWRIYLYPWAQFWYLQALATVFLIVFLFEKGSVLAKFNRWLIILSCTTLVLFVLNKNHHSGFFSIWGTVYILPFFLFGLGIRRYQEQLLKKVVLFPAVLILIIGIILQQLNWFEVIDFHLGRRSILTLLMSFSIILILFRFRRKIQFLAWFGYYAYVIYLFHVFGGSGSRILLTRFGVENKLILFTCVMLPALLLPILIERITLPLKWPRLFLLGLRRSKF